MKQTTQVIKVKCHNCNCEQDFNIYPVIDLLEVHDTDLMDRLFNFDLFYMKCPVCSVDNPVLYNCLVTDLNKKFMIYLFNENQMEKFRTEIVPAFEKNWPEIFQKVKNTRVVYTPTELIEKINIFDYGLNDEVIERLKDYLKTQDDGCKERGLNYFLFQKLEKDKIEFLGMNIQEAKATPQNVLIPFELYNGIIDEFKIRIEPETELFKRI